MVTEAGTYQRHREHGLGGRERIEGSGRRPSGSDDGEDGRTAAAAAGMEIGG